MSSSYPKKKKEYVKCLEPPLGQLDREAPSFMHSREHFQG